MKPTLKEIIKLRNGLQEERNTLPEYNCFEENNWIELDQALEILDTISDDPSDDKISDLEDRLCTSEYEEVFMLTWDIVEWLKDKENADDLNDYIM